MKDVSPHMSVFRDIHGPITGCYNIASLCISIILFVFFSFDPRENMKGRHLTKRIKLNVRKYVISFLLCFRGPVSLMSAEKYNCFSFMKSVFS